MIDSSELQDWNLFGRGVSAFPSQLPDDLDLQIWCASLNSSHEDRPYHLSLLSVDEKARAERFYFERDQRRFITGRSLLRRLLGGYLGLEPSKIHFTYGVHGKPALAARINGRSFQFNVSHSNDTVLFIFNWDRPVGIDIEYIQPLKDLDDFALQFFTPHECKFIHSLSEEQKLNTFFKIWTGKEAFLKANGSGLTVPINHVEVRLTMDGLVSLTSIGDDREQAAHWRLEIFTPVSGFQAAFALAAEDCKVSIQYLNDPSLLSNHRHISEY